MQQLPVDINQRSAIFTFFNNVLFPELVVQGFPSHRDFLSFFITDDFCIASGYAFC